MSKAAELAALIGSGQAQGNKNLIINGNLSVWQRGTSKTFTSNDNSGYYTADRWGQYVDIDQGSGSLSVTTSQSTDVPSGQGFAYSLKGATTPSGFAKSGNDALGLFTYKVETYDANRLAWGASGAKPVTLSYWIKSDTAGTGTLQIRLTDSSTVSGEGDGNFYTKFTVNAANTWEYKTHVIPGNTQDSWRDNVSTIAMHIHWFFGSNQSNAATQDAWFRNNNHGRPHSGNTYDFMNNAGEAFITGVQLEIGEQATPFEHHSFGDELARCQRYYQIIPSAGSYAFPLVRHQSGTNLNSGSVYYPVTMRANATLTLDSSGSWIHKPNIRMDSGSASLVSSSPSLFTLLATPSTNDTSNYLAYSNNNVEADAEL